MCDSSIFAKSAGSNPRNGHCFFFFLPCQIFFLFVKKATIRTLISLSNDTINYYSISLNCSMLCIIIPATIIINNYV